MGDMDYGELVSSGHQFLKKNRPDLAAQVYTNALQVMPDDPESHYGLGLASQQTGDLEKAAGCYRQALVLKPDSVNVLMTLAACLQAQSDDSGAEKCYRQILEAHPEHAQAAFCLGTLYLHHNRIDEALQWLLKAFASEPDWGLLNNNLGRAYLLKGDENQALSHLNRATRQSPDLAEAWFNLGEINTKAGRYAQAVTGYQKAVRIDPGMIAAHNNMGNALKESKRYTEAIAAFEQVLQLDPLLPQGHYNLGGAYRLLENHSKAIAHLSQAIQLKPDYADAWNNLALTFKNLGDLDRAMKYFSHALQIDPELSPARWNRSFVHFLMGNWIEGWQDFEARFDVPQRRSIYPHRIDGTQWDGTAIPGKTLLVHDEQGLGDTIQFSRLLPWARQRCGHLILETRPELIPLLRENPGIDRFIVRSDMQPAGIDFDRYIPLMSIARLAGITPQHLIGAIPYITATKEKISRWRSRLPQNAARVGLVWSGRPQHGNDANRSCDISQFAPLFGNKNIQFVGLQKGPAAAQAEPAPWPNFENFGSSLDDFTDTAAILSQLDLLITVDTAVAHLAGAMGKPVWVLIPYIPDWRWGMRGTTSPWYPSMQLFRQHRPKDWKPVIDQINSHLKKLLV